MSDAPTDASLLPDSVAQIAAVIGWPATLALVAEFGGQLLRLRGDSERIAALIGHKALSRLCAAYPAQELPIPACKALALAERNRLIRADVQALEKTHSTRAAVRQMTRRYHVTERTIWRALSPDSRATVTPIVVPTLYQLPLI